MRVLDRCWGGLAFLRSGEARGLLYVLAEDVEAEEVGGTGFSAGSGDDGDDLAWPDIAPLFEQAFGDLNQSFS